MDGIIEESSWDTQIARIPVQNMPLEASGGSSVNDLGVLERAALLQLMCSSHQMEWDDLTRVESQLGLTEAF